MKYLLLVFDITIIDSTLIDIKNLTERMTNDLQILKDKAPDFQFTSISNEILSLNSIVDLKDFVTRTLDTLRINDQQLAITPEFLDYIEHMQLLISIIKQTNSEIMDAAKHSLKIDFSSKN